MEKKSVLLANFDVEGFVESVVRHLKNRLSESVNPMECVFCIEEGKRRLWSPFDTQEEISRELRSGDKWIFMTFADFDEDGTICADGKLYTEGKVEELDDDGEVEGEEFFVDMLQSIGYLVHREGDALVFEPALYDSSGAPAPPSVELIEDCGFLDGPMSSFVESFRR